jgi:hypothetical protein
MPIVAILVISPNSSIAGIRNMKLWLNYGSNKHSLNGDQWL